MRSDMPLSAWPTIADSRHAVLAALVQQLDRSQWLTSEEVAAHQYRQLAGLAGFHARACPAFAARLASARLHPADLGRPDGLAMLGELTRQMVQSGGHDVPDAALPPKHGPTGTVNTSGSTGEPVRVRRTALNWLHWLALSMRFHLWAEPDFAARLAVIRANLTAHGLRRSWAAPVALLFDTGPLLLIDIETDIDRQLDQLADYRPDSVIVYPSNLAALSEAMQVRGIGLPSVRRWRTLGETLTPDTRERVSAVQPAPIIDCYSTEELGYLGLACPDSPGTFHVPETVIVELLDEGGARVPAGEIGRVVVTDLHNSATPLIRYAVGDHAVAGGPCSCGRGLPTLTRVLGRTRNMIVKPDGTRHWPLTGYKQFREIAPIRQYQFRQHSVEHIEVRLVTDRPLSADEETALIAHLHWKLRHPFRITLRYFDTRLPLGNNGKFEEFLSLL